MTTGVFDLPEVRQSRIHVSHTQIPSTYLDPSQPPTKRIPFRQIRNVPFIKDVKFCMPSHVYRRLYHTGGISPGTSASAGTSKKGPLEMTYYKATFTLKELLQNYELRTGNFLALSESHSSTVTIHLNRGTLTTTMPHHIYQRSGLPNAVQVPSGGRKHEKGSQRWKVEVNLRQPSMVRGRKAFDRLRHAVNEVEGLRESRIWLVTEVGSSAENGQKPKARDMGDVDIGSKRSQKSQHDAKPGANEDLSKTSITTDPRPSSTANLENDPLATFHPTTIDSFGILSKQDNVLVPHALHSPKFLSTLEYQTSPKNEEGGLPKVLEDDIYELVEYLSLLVLEAPIVEKKSYDMAKNEEAGYLCNYRIPDAGVLLSEDAEAQVAESVQSVSWSGLMSSDWMTQLVVDLIRRSRTIDGKDKQNAISDTLNVGHDWWVAIQVGAHRTEAVSQKDGYTIILQSGDTEALQNATCLEYVGSIAGGTP